jgi:hypothetical protein
MTKESRQALAGRGLWGPARTALRVFGVYTPASTAPPMTGWQDGWWGALCCSSSRCDVQAVKHEGLRFSALLTEGDTERLELARV